MRPTPASRPPVDQMRPASPIRCRTVVRLAGTAALASACVAPPAFGQGSAAAQNAPHARQVRYEQQPQAELPIGQFAQAADAQAAERTAHAGPAPKSRSKPERSFFAKLFRLPSKNASAGRAPGGPPPPPPAPHLKYAFRPTPAPTPQPAPAPQPAAPAAPVASQASRATRAVGEEGAAPPPSPARFEAPRIVAAPATPVLNPVATPPTAPRVAAPVAARPDTATGRVSLTVPTEQSSPRRQFVPPSPVAPTEPPAASLVRAPAPPALIVEDTDFFPELSEAEADVRRLSPAAVVEAKPEPETPTLEATPASVEPARVAAAPTAAPTSNVAAGTQDSPFTGLSLTATDPVASKPVAPESAVQEPVLEEATVQDEAAEEAVELAVDSPSLDGDEPFTPTLQATAADEEEPGWDLTVAATDPAESTDSPEPAKESEPAAPAPPAARVAEANAPATAQPAAEPPRAEAPGRPDPTKLLEKLAARADRSLLMGFCPVTLRDDRTLAEGNDRYTAAYEGVGYRFTSAEAREKFVADPARYAPAAGGRDLVIASTGWGETVGSLAHAAWYRGRLYLFASRESMRRFVATPRDYLGG